MHPKLKRYIFSVASPCRLHWKLHCKSATSLGGTTNRPTKKTRWWFQISFIFTLTWGDDTIWLIFFKMGWSHQLENLVTSTSFFQVTILITQMEVTIRPWKGHLKNPVKGHERKNLVLRWFKVTFLSPIVGGHQQPLKGSFNHPKKVTSRIARMSSHTESQFRCSPGCLLGGSSQLVSG